MIFTVILLIKQQLYLDFIATLYGGLTCWNINTIKCRVDLDSIVFTEEWPTRNLQLMSPQGALEEHLKSDVIYKLQCTQFTTNVLTPRDNVNYPKPSPVPSRPGLELAEMVVYAADH